MKCEDMEPKIALFASGDLELSDAAAVESHLSRCPACASHLQQYHDDLGALHSLRDEPVDQSDRAAVRRAVLARIGSPGGKVRRFHLLFSPVSAAAAAVMSVALLVWWLNHPRTVRAPHEPASAVVEIARPSVPAAAGPTRQAIPSAATSKHSSRKPSRAEGRMAHLKRSADVPVVSAASKPDIFTPALLPPDDIAIKLETADPNVVIIWLASSKGGGRR
jgi:anti-sigma factor RsiW